MPADVPVLLRPLADADEHEARRAHEELAEDDFEFLLDLRAGEPWPDYVTRLDRVRCGLDVPPDRVPATFLVAQQGPDLVGRVSVRHELNAWLAEVGGHIGYAVRPAFRRRGVATEVLRQALGVARSAGVVSALVTCDDTNLGSATVIERCGGILQDVVHPAGQPVGKRRYWVATS